MKLLTRMVLLVIGAMSAVIAVLTLGIHRAADVVATHNTNNYLSAYSDVLVAAVRIDSGAARIDASNAVIAAMPRAWQISQYGEVVQTSSKLLAPAPVMPPAEEFVRFQFSDSDGRLLEALQRDYQFPDEQVVTVTFAVEAEIAAAFAAQQRDAVWRQLVPLLLFTSLLALLVIAGLIVLIIGPIRRLQEDLQRLKSGRAARLAQGYPGELRELAAVFNAHLERSDATLGRYTELASNMAHAIKTPLTALRMEAQSAEDVARIDEIDALVERNLARARIAGSGTFDGTPVEVAPLVEGLARSYRKLYEIDLQTSCSKSLTFLGNPQDFVEAIGNVVDNACRHATSRVIVDVSDGRISVADDGPGIADGQREQVLQRGVRLDEVTTGAGIGLAIAHDIVAAYGGSIDIAASKYGGALLILDLPALADR